MQTALSWSIVAAGGTEIRASPARVPCLTSTSGVSEKKHREKWGAIIIITTIIAVIIIIIITLVIFYNYMTIYIYITGLLKPGMPRRRGG